MATLYVDFNGGNDSYSGTSFALLAQGTNGRITSTTFSSATASFPNDGSLIGQHLSIFNGSIFVMYRITAWLSATSLTIASIPGGTALANQAVDRQYYIGGRWKTFNFGVVSPRATPGDTIRVMGSPAPTSLGQNGVWTSSSQQLTKTISSSTNATPISVTCNAHGYSTGDTVVINGHNTNTNANGTWEITTTGLNTFTLTGSTGNGAGGATGTARLRNNTRVRLTSAVTENIASTGPGRAAWTSAGGANVTTSLNTLVVKEHAQSDQIAIGAGFTTGLAAYWTLPSPLDLSAYQQISFWFYQSSGSIDGLPSTPTQLELRLCSDTLGVTSVNSAGIPFVASPNRWMPVAVDLGTNLGSDIRSIALYVISDSGAQTVAFNNIIACKASSAADSLTLTSLIGKNTSNETYWGIQSINGTRVMLDADTNTTPFSATLRGYFGASEAVTTWKRETIKFVPVSSSAIQINQIFVNGSDTQGQLTVSGGWNRVDMSTQELETWIDGQNGQGYGMTSTAPQWLSITKIATVRCNTGFNLTSGSTIGTTLSSVTANNNTFYGIQFGSAGGSIDNSFACSNGNNGIQLLNNVSFGRMNVTTHSNMATGCVAGLTSLGIYTIKSYNNQTNEISGSSSPSSFFVDCLFGQNSNGAFNLSGTNNAYLRNCLIDSTVEFAGLSRFGSADFVSSQNHDQVSDNHKIFMNGALISAAVDQRNTPSGISWKMQPTDVNRNIAWPVRLSLAKVACAANTLVTIKAWMRRNNAGLTMRLVCKGGQIAGVANDVTASVTTTNAWEEETITFTPTETGVVEITAEAWGGITFSGWVDDLTISQA